MDTILLLLIVGILVVIAVGVWRLSEHLEVLADEVDKLRLSGRSTQRKAIMRDGALTEEREMVRLGRTSSRSRVVFGGDPDSALHQRLGREVADDVDG